MSKYVKPGTMRQAGTIRANKYAKSGTAQSAEKFRLGCTSSGRIVVGRKPTPDEAKTMRASAGQSRATSH